MLPFAAVPALPASAGGGPIQLISSSVWSDGPGSTQLFHLVGQIQNVSGGNVSLVQVNVHWTDATGNTAADTSTIATRTILGTDDYSPFDATQPFPAGDAVTASVTSFSYATPLASPYYLSATVLSCPASDPADEVCVSVTNNSSKNAALQAVDGVNVILTYTDTNGNVVGTDEWAVDNSNGGSVFQPGDSGGVALERSNGPSNASVLADAEPAYPLDINPASLDLGVVDVGKTGQRDLTVSNTGQLPITISGLQALPSQFSASTDCPNSVVGANLSCHVTVQFTPASSDPINTPVTGTLTFNGTAAGTPYSVPISATPAVPKVALNPLTDLSSTVLDFGNSERVGAPGLMETAVLRNTGTGPLSITSIATDDARDFLVDGSGCPISPSTLPAGQQCPISVTFDPPMAGPYGNVIGPYGSPPNTNNPVTDLVVTDNAGNGTQMLPLTGFATGPGAQFLASAVNFGLQQINTTSQQATVTIQNNGSQPLLMSGVSVTAQFSETDSCMKLPPLTGSSLPALLAGASCSFQITFAPTQLGLITGQLTLTDNAGIPQQSIQLSGRSVAGSVVRSWLRIIASNTAQRTPPPSGGWGSTTRH